MDNQITVLLESPSPQDRKKAIRMLAKMGGPDALRTLAGVYKYDEDQGIRDLAIQAGKHIKKQQPTPQSAQPTANAAPSYYRYAPEAEVEVEEEPEPEKEVEITPQVVSAGKLQQAKGMLDRALDLSMSGEDDKAIDSLVKAFKTNPNYRLDSYAMSIAYNITGMDKKDMLAFLSDDQRIRSMKSDAKQKVKKDKAKRREESGEVTWDTVALDITLYYIIMAGLLMVGLLLMVQINRSGVAAAAQPCPTCSAADHSRLLAVVKLSSIDGWKDITPVQGILYGLGSGLGFILYLLFYFGVLHMVARVLLAQDGSYRGVLHSGARAIMLTYGLGTGLCIVAGLVIMRENFNPHYYELYGAGGFLGKNPIWFVLVIIGVCLTFGGGYWLSIVISSYYEVEWSEARRVMFITYMITSTVLGWISTEVTTRLITIPK